MDEVPKDPQTLSNQAYFHKLHV